MGVRACDAAVRTPTEAGWRYGMAVAELAGTSLLIVAYFLIRGAHPDDVPASVDRTLGLVDFERTLGIFHEQQVQALFARWEIALDMANLVYVWGMYPVMAAVAVWLAFKDLGRFRFLRNVMLVSAVLGLAGYWLFPAAPPRLLATNGHAFGFLDTVHGSSRDLQPAPFLNEYAAIPSFHFAWVVLASVALWANTDSRVLKGVAVAVSAAMFWAIVVTGNHLFIDLVIGLAVLGAAWLLTLAGTAAFERWRSSPPSPVPARTRPLGAAVRAPSDRDRGVGADPRP